MKELRELIHHANLTKTQKTIAEFILDNSSEACFMTSTEIAQKLAVSESSVIRFSRSLGYSGFMDFQKALRKSYQGKVLSILKLHHRSFPAGGQGFQVKRQHGVHPAPCQ